MKMLLLIIILMISIIFVGCSHFQDELNPSRICYANKYKEIIESQRCADGSVYYKYNLRLIGFVQSPHKFGFMYNDDREHYNTLIYEVPSDVESKLLKSLKDKGLFLNDFKYIYTNNNDLYIVVYGSPKPSSRPDKEELRKHYDILKLKKLKKIYNSITNEVPKCDCRYCTSGLDEKYWM